MLLAFGITFKRHTALLAKEWPVRRVRLSMDAERRSILERFVADVATIRSFIAVRFEMTN